MTIGPVPTRASGWTDCAAGAVPGTDTTALQLRFQAVAARVLAEATWTPQPTPTAPDAPRTPPGGQIPTPGPVQPGPVPEPPYPGAGPSSPTPEPPTPEEGRLMDRIEGEIADDPRAQRAFKELVADPSFQSLPPESRIAILSQARNYPDARSIHNLGRLCGREWFVNAGLDDQQRFAKVIAFTSQYGGGDTRILNNTLDRVLGDAAFGVEWHDFGPEGAYGDLGRHGGLFGIWGRHLTMRLNRSLVPAGNGPIDASDKGQIAVAVETLAHETNHHINGDPEKADGSYRHFMAEYRAWYVGYVAVNGHPPSAEEAYARARFLVGSTDGGYGKIGRTFNDVGSDDSKRMVAFLARIMGLDPATATWEQVRDPSNVRVVDSSSTVGLPPKVRDGLPPEKADEDDPDNVDNG